MRACMRARVIGFLFSTTTLPPTSTHLSQRRRRLASRMMCCRAPPSRLLLRVDVTSECSALSCGGCCGCYSGGESMGWGCGDVRRPSFLRCRGVACHIRWRTDLLADETQEGEELCGFVCLFMWMVDRLSDRGGYGETPGVTTPVTYPHSDQKKGLG